MEFFMAYIFSSRSRSGGGVGGVGVNVIARDGKNTLTPGVSRQAVGSGKEGEDSSYLVGGSGNGVSGSGGDQGFVTGGEDTRGDDEDTQTPGVSRHDHIEREFGDKSCVVVISSDSVVGSG